MTSCLTARHAPFYTPASEEIERAAYVEKIRAVARKAIDPEQVHVRGMWLCNSERDYYYSRFTKDALNEIAEMLPSRPVMRGHDYNSLPLGLFFDASVELRREPRRPLADSYWVRGLFYLPRDAEGDAVAKRIDLGIYREASIGWRCMNADCSICDGFIGTCGHVPGEIYDAGLCEYRFSGVTNVLEGSLVFAGGQKGTSTFMPDADRLRDDAQFADKPLTPVELYALARSSDHSRADEPKRTSVQSVVCSKERFETQAEAARWCRDHDFRADKADVTEDSFRFRQFEPSACEEGSFRTITLDTGIKAVICKKRTDGRCALSERTLEEWFTKPGATPASTAQ